MNRSRDTASRFVRAASLAEIPDGKSKAVNLDGRMIALFNTGDGVFAVDNSMPPLRVGLAQRSERRRNPNLTMDIRAAAGGSIDPVRKAEGFRRSR